MISILTAYTKNKRVIGAQGKIPWKLSSERNRFKDICRDKYVIMGRKSFEEIGKPLPYCKLVVLSTTWLASSPAPVAELTVFASQTPRNDDIIIKNSLEEAIDFCKAQEQEEILIAGGGSIYAQALPYAHKIYATEIDADFDGDTFFPPLGPEWTSNLEETHEENGIKYTYLTYIRSSV